MTKFQHHQGQFKNSKQAFSAVFSQGFCLLGAVFVPLSAVSVSVSCVKKNLASTNNFVTKDSSSLIFSVSQNEVEMGRLRLCLDPYGNPIGKTGELKSSGASSTFQKCQEAVAKAMSSALPQFADSASTAAVQPGSDPTQAPVFDPAPSDPTAAQATNPADPASTSLNGTAKPLNLLPSAPAFLNLDGSVDPNAQVDVKIEQKEVKDVVHEFFSGNHMAPRCWYRWDRTDSQKMPGFGTSQMRVQTAANSLRLTKYSITSNSIVNSILADDKLRNLKLSVRNPETLKDKEFNKNLTELEQNQLWQQMKVMIGTSALTLSAVQIASWSTGMSLGTAEGLRQSSNVLIYAQLKSFTEKGREEIGDEISKRLIAQSQQNRKTILQDLAEIQKLVTKGDSTEIDEAAEAITNSEIDNALRRLKGRIQIKANIDNKLLKELPDNNLLAQEMTKIKGLSKKLDAAKFEDFSKAVKELLDNQKFFLPDFVTTDQVKKFLKPTVNVGDDFIRAINKPGVLNELASSVSRSLASGYRLCQGDNFVKMACITGISVSMAALTQFALSQYTSLGFRVPTVAQLEESDLALAANMFSSSKINLEISDEDFELLAYIEREAANSKSSLLDMFKNKQVKNLGFIPILGDDPSKTGVVCPTSAVLAKIMNLTDLDVRQFEAMKKLMEESKFSAKPSSGTTSATDPSSASSSSQPPP